MSQDALVTSVQPPVGGLNFRAPAIGLDPKQALILDNFLPRGSHIELRPGYKVFCTNLSDEVRTLAAYVGATEFDDRVFAFTVGGEVYDVTSPTDEPQLVLKTGQLDGVWECINKPGIDKNYLVMVSPAGGYWTYDAENGFTEREITADGAG